MGETKKVKHAGRFGSRYGKGIRDRIVGIEEKQRALHICPNCGFKRVKRISTGLFKCKKCGFVFAGGAFTPSTMSGRIVRKMVSQRKFLPVVKELIALREEKTKGLEEKRLGEKEKKKAEGKIEQKKEKPKKEGEKTGASKEEKGVSGGKERE